LLTIPSSFGGADGSLFLFNEAHERAENNGLQAISDLLGSLAAQFDVGVGDMFQFAAAHATATCPLGPRIRTWVGRPDATQASPPNLLPAAEGVGSDSTTLMALFLDKGIPALDLVALVGSHSVSKQFFYDTTRAGLSQDETPGVWDTKFYDDTINSEFPIPGTPAMVTFDSDKNLSQDPALTQEWNGYAASQNDWVEHFSRAYLRLSLVGVPNINDLIECESSNILQKCDLLI